MTYEIVGWYSVDGADKDVVPFSRTVEVEADSHSQALDIGFDTLHNAYDNPKVDFLNLCAREKKV